MSFCSSLQVTISGQLSARLSYVSLELNGVIGVLGKVWKGFDFWKDSYVVHVPLKWHRGEKSLSALQGLAQLWEDSFTSSLTHFLHFIS